MFKKIFIISLFSVSLIRGQNNEVRIDSYDIKADFSGNTESASLNILVNFINPPHITSSVLLLSSQAENIIIINPVTRKKIDYKFIGTDTLQIFFPDNAGTDSFTLRFDYSFPVSVGIDSVLILDRGHRWYPIIPDNIAKFTVTCKIPLHFDALFPGIIKNKKNYESFNLYEWESNYPQFKAALIIFREKIYREFRCDLSGNIIALYYFPDDSLDIKKIITETGRMMNYCGAGIGAYNRERLTLIEIPGLEGINICSGLLMIGSNDLKYINKGYYDGLLLSIAEQWFGAGVFSKFGANGFWITSLSFPHYIRMMYLKETYGVEKFNDALIKPLDKYKEFAGSEKDIAIYDVDMPNSPEKAQVLYIKGPYMFFKLNNIMGDEKWKDFLRELYRKYFGKVMSLNDFIFTMKKYDADGNAVKIFNNMIFQKGLPE